MDFGKDKKVCCSSDERHHLFIDMIQHSSVAQVLKTLLTHCQPLDRVLVFGCVPYKTALKLLMCSKAGAHCPQGRFRSVKLMHDRQEELLQTEGCNAIAESTAQGACMHM